MSLQDDKHVVTEDIFVSDYHVLYDNDLLFLKPPSYYTREEFTQHSYTGSANESILSYQESSNVVDDNKSSLNDKVSGSVNLYSVEEETLRIPVSSGYYPILIFQYTLILLFAFLALAIVYLFARLHCSRG